MAFVVEPVLSVAEKIRRDLTGYVRSTGYVSAGRPAGESPTLEGVPKEMDLSSADVLHIHACRWLEYAEDLLALEEAALFAPKMRSDWYEREVKNKYKGKIEQVPPELFAAWRETDEAIAEIEARRTLLQGIKRSLEKVRSAASRAITRHTKSTGMMD